MEYDSTSKNIVVVQDLTNGLGHIIESNNNKESGTKKRAYVEFPSAPLPVPLPSMSWNEADKTEEAFRITRLHDSSLAPDQELSESESQINEEVKWTTEWAKEQLNEQN